MNSFPFAESRRLPISERFKNPVWEDYKEQRKKLLEIEMTDNPTYILAHVNLFCEYLLQIQMQRLHQNPIKIANAAALVEKTGEWVTQRAEHCTTKKGNFTPARITTTEEGRRQLSPSFVTVTAEAKQ